jgi:hypothetical protein
MNIKTGIDYFPFDIDFFQDEKIQFVSARFGTRGEAITIRLLCKLYRNGYYYTWDEDTALLFAKSVGDGCSDSCVNDVVYELVKRGFFDKGIFDTFSILTSRGIQKRYLEAGKRRKNLDVEESLLLVDVSDYQNVSIVNEDVYILNKNVCINKQNAHESKVKEKESKGKEKRVYGELAHVRLSDDEYKKLIDEFGQVVTQDYINQLDNYIGSKGKRYKSHYATIRTWLNRDIKEGKVRKGPSSGNQFADWVKSQEAL